MALIELIGVGALHVAPMIVACSSRVLLLLLMHVYAMFVPKLNCTCCCGVITDACKLFYPSLRIQIKITQHDLSKPLTPPEYPFPPTDFHALVPLLFLDIMLPYNRQERSLRRRLLYRHFSKTKVHLRPAKHRQ